MSKGMKYSGSNDVNKVAWVEARQTQVIGLKSPNELGLYDVSGNVWDGAAIGILKRTIKSALLIIPKG